MAVLAADALEGGAVLDREGRTLGTIDDVVVDLERGTIAYAVMSIGKAARGEKLFAVPWRALTFDAERNCFRMDAAGETYEVPPAS